MARTAVPRLRHVPVLADAVVRFLARPDAILIDGTVGDGGHAAALLTASGRESRLLGLDLDPVSVARAADTLRPFGSRARLVHETFAHVAEVATREGFAVPTGMLFDLGMATHHLTAERGFSFRTPGSLDMRFDPSGNVPLPTPELVSLRQLAERLPSYRAADILAVLREDDLAEVLRAYGDERHAERIADAVVRVRRRAPITSAPELVRLVVAALPPRARHGRLHAATRTFQALRIAVNRERESLLAGIRGALALLAPGGRLAVIAFHSLEDRLVKELFREAARMGECRLLTKHPLQATIAERKENPWSRSARLRVIERCPSISS